MLLRKDEQKARRIEITISVLQGRSYNTVGRTYGISGPRVAAILSRTLREISGTISQEVKERVFPKSEFPNAYRVGDSHVHFTRLHLDDLRKASRFLIDHLKQVTIGTLNWS